jgi:serine/threonine-protein kinase
MRAGARTQAGAVVGGRYRLDELLGAGGMAEVHAGRDLLLDRRVAVKLPSARTPTARERFRREARAAAALNHRNVVAVFDWGESPDPYLVMELVEGRHLRDLLTARGSLPPSEVAGIGAQVADALEHAHAHGVVHRDVKPSNLLVASDGTVKVTDFGISKSVSADALTEPGGVIGTPGYLSPEQAAGLPADPRSDVYALGVVLRELLTGARDATIDAGQRETELERVIDRACAHDPSARYQRAGDLRDALRAVQRALDASVTAVAVMPTRTPIATAMIPALAPVPSIEKAKSAEKAEKVKKVKPLEPPKVAREPRQPSPPRPPKVRGRRRREKFPKLAKQPRPARPPKLPKAARERRWRTRHVLALVSAPLVLGLAGFTYWQATRPATVEVPKVVDKDVFTAAYMLRKAGLEVDSEAARDPRPGGVVLAQHPRAGMVEEGSTVRITVSAVVATVPDVVGGTEEDAVAALHRVGFVTVHSEDDYRDDVDPGTVVGVNPVPFSEAAKTADIALVVARDPHVSVRNVVAVDQGTATANLQQDGLDVSVKTASSGAVPAGVVISQSPSGGRLLVRGDTVTLTVSSGPRMVKVPYVVSWDADDAVDELEDAGFTVSFATTPVGSGEVGEVVAQTPPGGQAPEGSDVTVTVGVRKR